MKLAVLGLALAALSATTKAETLHSKDHPDVAALALDLLEANCPAEKVNQFKFFNGNTGFKFEVLKSVYSTYKTLEILARNEGGAIYMVKDFEHSGAPGSCEVQKTPIEPQLSRW
jgi:hypothetical protein